MLIYVQGNIMSEVGGVWQIRICLFMSRKLEQAHKTGIVRVSRRERAEMTYWSLQETLSKLINDWLFNQWNYETKLLIG